MASSTTYARHAYSDKRYPDAPSIPQLLSSPYQYQTEMGVPAVRTTSLPASTYSRLSRPIIEPVFSIRPAGANWKKLPPLILNLVLDHLRQLHIGSGSGLCSTCYMRDLASVQLTCKGWFSDAQRILYTNIPIVGRDDPAMLVRWKLSRAARLIRLRSTLRSRPLLAALVKTLHVTDPHIPLYQADGEPNPEYNAYLCTLASIVMTCPNFEALDGFYCFYNHTFERLTHALSTRTKLRQHAWIIAENDDVSERSQTQLPPGLLDDSQTYQFTLYHARWKHLETLMLCSPGSLGIIEHELFIRVLHSLPALRNLCISSFDADDFHDTTLLSLPPWVTTLRLEECLGVTDAGLTRWAGKPNAAQITRLMLLHQNITSLLTLSKIFASLDRLVKFTIVQDGAVPTLPKEGRHVLVQPVLASKSLQFLHWDVLARGAGTTGSNNESMDQGQATPNMHLALSISNRGFPSLIQLRAPRDTTPPGILQSVCQTNNNEIVLPDDIAQPYNFRDLRRSNSLRAARLRAQRINDHSERRNPSVQEDNTLHPPQDYKRAAPQAGQKSSSATSTSTISSLGTLRSNSSNNSTGTTATNRSSGQDRVSPVSPGQGPFSPLAPDDGVISPIATDREQMYLSGGDSDKQAVSGPEKRKKRESWKRESLCRCTPDPAMSSSSICVCEAHDTLKPAEAANTAAAPPRSVFRPAKVQVVEPPRTRFPSLIAKIQPVDENRTRFPSLTVKRPQRCVPALYLKPDVAGHNGNGGLIGWGDLLRVSEKAKMSSSGPHAANDLQGDSKATLDEDNDDEIEVKVDTEMSNMCTGSGERTSLKDQAGELPVLKKSMTAPATSIDPSTKGRSKSKSSSRLTLSLGRKALEKEILTKKPPPNHIARPRGERGNCVSVHDFF